MEKTASDVINRMLILLSLACGLWFGSCNMPLPGHVVIYGPPQVAVVCWFLFCVLP
ncbi:unnamed protein product [Trifolium pratense]|uniref:Uncharacterized protein n=1 Tax=Trifolium pratense TaxID=57577 RepID=A0ACB0LIR2_TRIPR|nr:unnamed protein product [Trifolium pratense]